VSIRLIAMDIDGTLLDSTGRLPDENLSTIEQAEKRGIRIVIVTGRRFDSARSIAAKLSGDVHLIANNGALIKSKTGETLYRKLLPVGTARDVLEATPEHRASAGVIFDRPDAKQVVLERVDWENPFVGPYLRRHRHHVAEIAPLTSCLDAEDPVEVLFLGECAAMRRIMEVLERLPIARNYRTALTEYERRNLSMLDVLESSVSKGAALAEFARQIGITRDEVMAIGDNWNDREMLEYAGLSVVMENSVPELKSMGWKVTLSNDECGVSHAIRTFVLRQ
jgi:Cof subfamily protein (haloacid dehalogenase superfamily)